MSKLKAQRRLSGFQFFSLAFFFFVSVSALPAEAKECVSQSPPVVVSHSNSISGNLEAIFTKDNRGLSIGKEGAPGWLVLDLDCFVDQNGTDLDLYILGLAKGGQVYVGGDKSPIDIKPGADGQPGGDWLRIPEAIPPHYRSLTCTRPEYGCDETLKVEDFACDGRETLPKSSESCQSGDQWFSLDIGKNDSTQYRYVYFWSHGLNIDILKASPVRYDLDLFARISSNPEAQFIEAISPGTRLNFRAELTSKSLFSNNSKISYQFSCGQGSANQPGFFSAQGLAEFICQYALPGNYNAEILVSTSDGQIRDLVRVAVSPSRATPKSSNKDILTWVLLVIVLGIIGWLVFKKFKNKEI